MIRSAQVQDIETLVNLSEEFYPETEYFEYAPWDRETVTELTSYIVQNGIYLVAEHEGKIVGQLAAVLTPFLFNKNVLNCSEVVWYVSPEMRSTGLGWELIKRADTIRKLRGAKRFQMMRLATSPDFLDRGFMDLGFHVSEICHTKVN